MPKVVTKPTGGGRRLSLPGSLSSEDSFVEAAEPKVVTPVPKFHKSKHTKRAATSQNNSKRQKLSDDDPWKSAIPLPSIPLHPEELDPEDQVNSLKRLLRWYIGREKELLQFLEEVPRLQAEVDQLTAELEQRGESVAAGEVSHYTNRQGDGKTGTFSKPPKAAGKAAKKAKEAEAKKDAAAEPAAKKKKEEEGVAKKKEEEAAARKKKEEEERLPRAEKEEREKEKKKPKSKGRSKKSEEEKSVPAEEPEPPADGRVYRIEELLAETVSEGALLHLVAWRDYPLKEATWEPLAPEVLASLVGREWAEWKRANPGRTHKASHVVRTFTKGPDAGCAVVELDDAKVSGGIMRLETLPPGLPTQSKR